MKRYNRENMVILKVPHVRIMDGETDRVVCRHRTEEVSEKVLDIISGRVKEPDWFVERWVDEEKQLYVTAAFEEPAESEKFAAELLAAGTDYVWHDVGDEKYEAFVAKEVDDFNAQWEAAHAKSLEEINKELDFVNHNDVLFRTTVCSVPCDKEEDVRPLGKLLNNEINAKLREDKNDGAPEYECKFSYAPVYMNNIKRFFISFKFDTMEDQSYFRERVKEVGGWKFEDACHVLKLARDPNGMSGADERESYLCVLAALVRAEKKSLKVNDTVKDEQNKTEKQNEKSDEVR